MLPFDVSHMDKIRPMYGLSALLVERNNALSPTSIVSSLRSMDRCNNFLSLPLTTTRLYGSSAQRHSCFSGRKAAIVLRLCIDLSRLFSGFRFCLFFFAPVFFPGFHSGDSGDSGEPDNVSSVSLDDCSLIGVSCKTSVSVSTDTSPTGDVSCEHNVFSTDDDLISDDIFASGDVLVLDNILASDDIVVSGDVLASDDVLALDGITASDDVLSLHDIAASGDVLVSSDVPVSDDTLVSDDAVTSDDVVVSDELLLSSATSLTVLDNSIRASSSLFCSPLLSPLLRRNILIFLIRVGNTRARAVRVCNSLRPL